MKGTPNNRVLSPLANRFNTFAPASAKLDLSPGVYSSRVLF